MSARQGVVATIMAAVVVAIAIGMPGTAQDRTELRIEDLEARVAVLKAQVFGSPIASPVIMSSPIASSGTLVADTTIEFLGDRSTVSDECRLDAGTYRVRVEVPPITIMEHLVISLQPAPGSAGNGFAGLVNDYRTEGLSGEFLVTIYTGGEFVIVADGNRPYIVTVER